MVTAGDMGTRPSKYFFRHALRRTAAFILSAKRYMTMQMIAPIVKYPARGYTSTRRQVPTATMQRQYSANITAKKYLNALILMCSTSEKVFKKSLPHFKSFPGGEFEQ
jgi:hypothetical protein